jgi:hypothetical protein
VFVDLGKTFNWDTLRVSRVDKTTPRLRGDATWL